MVSASVDAAACAERERIADDIGDAAIDLRGLIMMREHHGIAFAFEFFDARDVGRGKLPLGRRHGTCHARIEMRRRRCDVARIRQRETVRARRSW